MFACAERSPARPLSPRAAAVIPLLVTAALGRPALAEQPATEPVEVIVRGQSAADRARRSAEAVHVVELEQAEREGADLGEVLRRQQGVGMRRSGGLGSDTRFSLGGMTDSQIRFFLDGVPLELAGFGLGLSIVPVNLVERVELFRGVVPVRFGTDALGGAVNLVSDDGYRRTRAGASYQVGSFGLYRATAVLRHPLAGTPFVASAAAFVDRAENDYPMLANVPNAMQRPVPTSVRRAHDGYSARGGSLELGVVDRPWAQRLLLKAHTMSFRKEIPHNEDMTRPYGEVRYSESTTGATFRYEQPLRFVRGLKLSALAAYAHSTVNFADRGQWTYDWYGRRIRRTLQPGEIEDADDTTTREHRVLGRLTLSYLLGLDHALRLSSTWNQVSRSGRNALFESTVFLDPASAQNRLTTVVTGLEHELDALDGDLENILFVKDYVFSSSGQGGHDYFGAARVEDGFYRHRTSTHRLGAGDGIRYHVLPELTAKASYEHATRFPEADELYGDGVLLRPNLELEPERSHNANLGVTTQGLAVLGHELRGEVSGFFRDSDRLIFAAPLGQSYRRNSNVWSTRARGLEAAAGYRSPGGYVAVDANVTWADVRNTSTEGPFADFRGDRIPNRPWFFANASARLEQRGVSSAKDVLSLAWYTNHVRSFFRSWESTGRADSKLTIGAQWLHSAALTYLVRSALTLSTTLEVQNLTDAPAYDFLGVPKPGRAFYFKGTME